MKLKKIDWNQVTALDSFVLHDAKIPKRTFAKHRLKASLFTRINISDGGEYEYLCFRSLERSDYKNLFELIVDTIDSPKVVVQDFTETGLWPNWQVILNILLNWQILFLVRAPSIAEKLYLYTRLCAYIVVLKKIRKISFNKLVLFADMQPIDNLLAQYYQHKTTVTLQHGLYVDYADSDTINTINYSNQPSHYFLAWGEDTKNLITLYHPDRKVVICGKPNINDAPAIRKPAAKPYFTVIFDQNMFHEYNLRLLDIAYRFAADNEMWINLRLHPWNNPKWYRIDENVVLSEQVLENSTFVIGHTTSMIYELLRMNVPAYKLKSDEFALDTPENLIFTDADELLKIHEANSNTDFRQTGMNYIAFCGQGSLDRYGQFFASL
jgi:hypothetical protein